MECVKKRRLEETWSSCQPKRVCVGAGVCDQMTVCPVETLWGVDTAQQQQHQQQHQPQQQQMTTVQNYTSMTSLLDNRLVYPIQACPRCLSGEPGHINHIMGY